MDDLIAIYPEGRSILLVGTFPPPLGGVSVHIQRLHALLRKAGRRVAVFDPSRHNRFKGNERLAFLLAMLRHRPGAVHVHGFDFSRSLLRLITLAARLLGARVFATAHSFRLSKESPADDIAFHRAFLASVDTLIAVSPAVVARHKELGIAVPARTLVRPAFLPPPEEDEERIWRTYPREVPDFLARHKPVLVANAFKIIFFEGSDLYGIDLCIELAGKLRSRFPRAGFIFALADDSHERAYLGELRERIGRLELGGDFLLLTGQRELWPLLKRADAMLRPTNTDGDAVSVREAPHLGCRVIASDVCERPRGTVLFASRDAADLLDKVTHVLDEKSPNEKTADVPH